MAHSRSAAQKKFDAWKADKQKGLDKVREDEVKAKKEADDVKAAIEKLAAKVWYTKISITSYTATPASGTYEVGCTVNKPTLSWKTSKTPVKTVVNGVTQANPSTTSYVMPTDLTNTKTVSLAVTDEAGGTDTKTLTWTFAYGVYVGMATVPTDLTQDWIKNTLGGKTLKTTAKGTYTMKGSDTKYWWIATPKAWAERGDAEAQYQYAFALANLTQAERSPAQVAKWLRLSAQNGSESARQLIWSCGVDPDDGRLYAEVRILLLQELWRQQQEEWAKELDDADQFMVAPSVEPLSARCSTSSKVNIIVHPCRYFSSATASTAPPSTSPLSSTAHTFEADAACTFHTCAVAQANARHT